MLEMTSAAKKRPGERTTPHGLDANTKQSDELSFSMFEQFALKQEK
jgi:hypothetical protein